MTVSRARELQQLEGELLAAYAAGKPEAVSRRSAIWYDGVVVPVLVGLAYSVPAHLAVNIANNGLVPGLPDDTIVELTADIMNGEICPRPVQALPPPALFGMLYANAAYERTLVEAIVNDSADLLLSALLVNPMIHSYEVAHELLAELWPRRGWPAA
jgi:alpha-galactosidase/6-phospho-beta-glucosidase family protein